MRTFVLAAAIVGAALPTLAGAQQVDDSLVAPGEKNILDGDYVIVGGAVTYGPSYEGSNNYVVSGTPAVAGRIAGITITPRPGGLALDFIPEAKDAKVGFSLGPVVTYSRNRRSDIQDPVVRAAGKLKSAIDVGVSAGISAYKVLNPYDTLTLSTDVKWNVNSAYKGMVITPAVSYLTPLSKGAIASLVVSAKHVDNDYANYYYDVTAVQSLRSGLPVYNARGGWANVGVSLLGAVDLDGNLLNGGFSIVALGSYNRLLDDARRTPYTSIRGSADQFYGALGVAYAF